MTTEEKIVMPEAKRIKRPFVNNKCIGCGACVAICDEVFYFTEEGYAKAKKLESYEGFFVDDAISACPTEAISWID